MTSSPRASGTDAAESPSNSSLESVENELLRLVLEMIPFTVFWKDRDSVYLGCNKSFSDLAGLKSPADIVGLSDHDLPWSEEETANYREDDRQVIDSGEAKLHIVETQTEATGKQTWLDTSKVPLRDASGEIVGVVGVYADITEQRTNEMQLRETRAHLDVAIRAMDSAIVLYDRDERFVFCNEKYRELYSQSADILVPGQTYGNILTDFALAHPHVEDIAGWVSERLSQHRRCEKEWIQEINGHVIRVSDSRTADGGIVSLRTDVTALRRIEDELRVAKEAAESANEAKSAFLASMSHEIRTPMTAILGFTDLLIQDAQQDALSPEAALASLETIRRNGQGLLNIINDILDLSKVEAGKLDVSMETTSPTELLMDVLELLSVRAESAGVELTISPGGPLPREITTDPVRLTQILVNVVGNAIKFSPEGEVRIEPRWVHGSAGGKLEIAVADNGIGMSPEQLTRAFAPFEQATAKTATKFGGTGLGLAISTGLADLIGAELNAESEPGKGSRFTLRLGVHESVELREPDFDGPRERLTQEALPLAGNSPTLSGLRVLLAEDGLDNQLLISKVLNKAGAEVTCVPHGEAAVTLLLDRHEDFDLVLMDMQMPILDGYEATRTLRQAGIDLPIIALTANAMSSDREECLAAGCTDYVAKPVEFRTLIDRCRDAVPAAA